MLWHAGKILDDSALAVGVLDRTFEHGLGLFETLRTWGGRPTLLDRHLARLARSAQELGLPLDPDQLPDPPAVERLARAEGLHGQDVALRITLSGGTSGAGGSSTAWMRLRPLPPPLPEAGVSISTWFEVAPDDPLARHKTLNYWRRRIALEAAQRIGDFDALAVSADCQLFRIDAPLPIDGRVWETSRANVFAVKDGRLYTPGPAGPFLRGVMRGLVIEHAQLLGLEVQETDVDLWHEDPPWDEVFLTNSLRGIIPVAVLTGFALDSPGPVARQLWANVLSALESGEVGS